MEIFKIVKDNKPSLRQRCENVDLPLNEKYEKTLLDMVEYLRLSQDEAFLEKHHNIRSGVGLAAPQIGLSKNMLAISFINEKGKREEYAFVNPRIISESVKECYLESGEGCLSVDKPHEGFVYRHYKVTVKRFIKEKFNDLYIYWLPCNYRSTRNGPFKRCIILRPHQ